MDHGFSRIGPNLKADQSGDEVFVGGAGRLIGLSDAIIHLCKYDHAAEAVILLRPLVAISLAMRALAAGHADASLQAEMWDIDWKKIWSDPKWTKRLESAGLSAKELASAQSDLNPHGYSNLYAGSFSVPWAHVYSKHQHAAAAPEAVLSATVRAMTQALKALELRWPGNFASSTHA